MISDTRMSVYDVLLAQQEGDSLYEISGIYSLRPLQVEVAFEYIEEHRERLEAELPKLLAQKAARERHYRAIAAEREKEIRRLKSYLMRIASGRLMQFSINLSI